MTDERAMAAFAGIQRAAAGCTDCELSREGCRPCSGKGPPPPDLHDGGGER